MAQIFIYTYLKVISKWFHTYLPGHSQGFETRPNKNITRYKRNGHI